MRKYAIWLTSILLLLGWTCLPGQSQEASQATGKDVNVTVTVERHGPNAPAVLKADDVFVYQNHQRRPVVRWVPATGEHDGLDLAILLDDSLASAIGSHYPTLKGFIRSLPASTKVAIAYASHGNAQIAQGFTADHERAAAALRIPMGLSSGGPSIYMAVNDLIKHWPKDSERRAILALSDGVDLYWGITQALPGSNPDLERAVRAAQRHGVNVFTIYADTVGGPEGNSFLINAGQSCLSVLALASGGNFYSQGTQTPINFEPIFKNMKERLGRQYLLTFSAAPGKKGAYDRLRLSTEQPGIEFVAPSRVYVPGAAE